MIEDKCCNIISKINTSNTETVNIEVPAVLEPIRCTTQANSKTLADLNCSANRYSSQLSELEAMATMPTTGNAAITKKKAWRIWGANETRQSQTDCGTQRLQFYPGGVRSFEKSAAAWRTQVMDLAYHVLWLNPRDRAAPLSVHHLTVWPQQPHSDSMMHQWVVSCHDGHKFYFPPQIHNGCG